MPFAPLRSLDETSRAERVEALLNENERSLVAYAARLLGKDVERARDVVQETFLRLCRTEDLEGKGREWLFTVTRNLCVDVRRKESRMTSLETGEGASGAMSAADPVPTGQEALENNEALGTAINRLPERQQEALRLKFDGGLSYAEIARVMGTNAGTVGWLLHTAIQGLRTRMTPEGGLQ